MHRFRRQSQLILHRLNAFIWLMMLVLAVVTAGLLVAAFLTNDRVLALAGLGSACATLVIGILQRISSTSANCPLCRMPPMGMSACQKNSKARPFLGSYRLRVSLSTLLLNRFRCPYCGEPTRCSVKTHDPGESDDHPHSKVLPIPFR